MGGLEHRCLQLVLSLTALGAMLTFWALPTPVPAQEAAPVADAGHGPQPAARNVGGIDRPDGGTITGTVTFVGRLADRRPIRMGADKYCETTHAATPPLDERWVFGDRMGDDSAALANVFVYVSKGLEGQTFAAPADLNPEIDQIGCMYVPHVQGMVAGQELRILNGDNTLHNVKANPRSNPAFNEGMPVRGMELLKRFDKPEMAIEFKCDVHAWMTAYVHVMEHPFFAVTREDGTFTIHGLPPGEYEVSVWHEFGRFTPDQATLKVTVEGGKTSPGVDFVYRPPAAR